MQARYREFRRIGFIGLGVMGEPICRNLSAKSGLPTKAFDLDPAPMKRLEAGGVYRGKSVGDVVRDADIVFLSLPSGEVVDQVVHAGDGVLSAVSEGQIVVDLSTSPVDLMRGLAKEFAPHGVTVVDAPVARTRAAAEAGTLSVMIGADSAVYERIKPLIATFATEITLCGTVGCGQVVKILNNMLLFQIGLALSEARAIGRHAGVDAGVLFDTLAKGSADSFALRNHGIQAILPGKFPLRAFSVKYARKDLGYALRLAEESGIAVQAARQVDSWFARAVEAGLGEHYWPVISQLIDE